MNTELTITEFAPLREALKRIESNNYGIILGTDEKGCVTGLATDGDIRRKLLEGVTLEASLSCCLNRDFIFADKETSRELLLKQLDQRIRVIPVLDIDRRLVDIVSRDHLPVLAEESVYARARAPVRISFGGGGSDVTHFFMNHHGSIINTTIALYSHATLRVRGDSNITVASRDLKDTMYAANLKEAMQHDHHFGLIRALIRTVHPNYGFDLYLHSDFPMNSGLGGSAVVSAAVLGCFNQFRKDKWDLHEIAELAFQAERLHLGVAGGWQDQYASVFGGFNFMEFRMDQNIVHPLRVHPDILTELEESLVLCDTGTSHDSGAIHDDQRQQASRGDIAEKVKQNVELTYRMRDHLLRGRLMDFGKLIHEAWKLKRSFSSKITNSNLDQVYNIALQNGAVGGKLMGAGGGGFFIFYAPPFAKHDLLQALEEHGLAIRPFLFDHAGLRSWTVRERMNDTGVSAL